MKIALVLRSGGDYDVSDVEWLVNQLPAGYEVLCFTDFRQIRVPRVKRVPLINDWSKNRGWWAKIELFRPDIEEDLFYLDLDTVITGDITAILESKPANFTMLRDFYHPQYLMSSVMWIPARDKAKIWTAFWKDPKGWMKNCVTTEYWGDQGFLRKVMGDDTPCFNDIFPDWLKSYKANILKVGTSPFATTRYSKGDGTLPADCRMVIFHGNPRPRNVKEPWIPGSLDYTPPELPADETDSE